MRGDEDQFAAGLPCVAVRTFACVLCMWSVVWEICQGVFRGTERLRDILREINKSSIASLRNLQSTTSQRSPLLQKSRAASTRYLSCHPTTRYIVKNILLTLLSAAPIFSREKYPVTELSFTLSIREV